MIYFPNGFFHCPDNSKIALSFGYGIMKFIKFSSAIIFWVILLASVAAAIHFRDYREACLAIKQLEKEDPLSYIGFLSQYFEHSDQWNKVYIAIIASILLFLFALNDYWIKRRLRNFLRNMQKFSYITGVLGWMVHKLSAAALVLFQFIAIINIIIILSAEPFIYRTGEEIPEVQYGLLLGTNKMLPDNKTINLYYQYRIDAAWELYKKGKIRKIIISGDRNGAGYNEPMDMMRDLAKKGVPGNDMTLDYAGFRTLDSIVRLKYQFGISNVAIISQKFHLQRALFLAQYYRIKAIGCQSKGTMTASMLKRELLAKPRVILDIFAFNMQPKEGQTASRQQIQFARPQHKTLVISVAFLLLITAWFFTESLRFKKY